MGLLKAGLMKQTQVKMATTSHIHHGMQIKQSSQWRKSTQQEITFITIHWRRRIFQSPKPTTDV